MYHKGLILNDWIGIVKDSQNISKIEYKLVERMNRRRYRRFFRRWRKQFIQNKIRNILKQKTLIRYWRKRVLQKKIYANYQMVVIHKHKLVLIKQTWKVWRDCAKQQILFKQQLCVASNRYQIKFEKIVFYAWKQHCIKTKKRKQMNSKAKKYYKQNSMRKLFLIWQNIVEEKKFEAKLNCLINICIKQRYLSYWIKKMEYSKRKKQYNRQVIKFQKQLYLNRWKLAYRPLKLLNVDNKHKEKILVAQATPFYRKRQLRLIQKYYCKWYKEFSVRMFCLKQQLSCFLYVHQHLLFFVSCLQFFFFIFGFTPLCMSFVWISVRIGVIDRFFQEWKDITTVSKKETEDKIVQFEINCEKQKIDWIFSQWYNLCLQSKIAKKQNYKAVKFWYFQCQKKMFYNWKQHCEKSKIINFAKCIINDIIDESCAISDAKCKEQTFFSQTLSLSETPPSFMCVSHSDGDFDSSMYESSGDNVNIVGFVGKQVGICDKEFENQLNDIESSLRELIVQKTEFRHKCIEYISLIQYNNQGTQTFKQPNENETLLDLLDLASFQDSVEEKQKEQLLMSQILDYFQRQSQREMKTKNLVQKISLLCNQMRGLQV